MSNTKKIHILITFVALSLLTQTMFGYKTHAFGGYILATKESPFEEHVTKVDHKVEYIRYDRVELVKKYLEKHNSPLVPHAETFVEEADKYGFDYRLLVAIAGVESTFGKRYIENSYNVWGWGIYGNNVIYFNSFDDGIQKVSRGIYEGYVSKGADTVEKMAPIYNPPHPDRWLANVKFFMNQIEELN